MCVCVRVCVCVCGGVGVWGCVCHPSCSEVAVAMSLILPSSSFRLYPSGRLSLSLTFQSLMVLSVSEGNGVRGTGEHILDQRASRLLREHLNTLDI